MNLRCVFTPGSKTGGVGNVWCFFTSWDAKAYNVYFLAYPGDDTTGTEITNVRYYTSYTVTSSNVEIQPSDFSSISTHILTGYYVGEEVSCKATACWITQDGTTLYGFTETYGTSEDGGLLQPIE